MQRAKLKMQTEVEFIKFERDFTIAAGDFLVIADGGQEVLSPPDFLRRYEFEEMQVAVEKKPTPPPVHISPVPLEDNKMTTVVRRVGNKKRSPHNSGKNFKARPLKHSIHHDAAMELLDTIKLLYADQLGKMSAEQLQDPNQLRGITLREVYESQLLQKRIEEAETVNASSYLAQLAYLLMDHDLLVREKFYVYISREGLSGRKQIRAIWHFRPT